jgi:hypothetical protein
LIEIAGRIRAVTAHDDTARPSARAAPDEPAGTTLVGTTSTTHTDTNDESMPHAADQTDDVDSHEHAATRDEPDPTRAKWGSPGMNVGAGRR